MKKPLTAKFFLPTLLLAVLVFLIPTAVAFAGIGEWLYEDVVVAGFGKIVGWAGSILDYAINDYVVGFGDRMSGNIGVVVNDTWAIVRDLFNLTFIFGLVYIGFKMILRSDDSNTRRWLVNLIIAALLVNFSLFITKFVIDFSNIVAVEIINMGLEPDSGSTGAIFDFNPATGVQISTSMQQAIGVITTMGPEGSQTSAGGAPKEVTMSIILGTLMIFLVAAFVYFSAGILLIIRAAVLVVLMILSPFLFIGMVLPMFQSTASKLWSTLFKRAFLAPIYIIFLFITLKISETVFEGSFAGAFAAAEGADVVESASNSFGPFILVTALLIMSLTVAQKLGAEGAGAMINMGNQLRKGTQARIKRRGIGMARGAARGAGWAAKEAALGATHVTGARYLARKGISAAGRKLKYGTIKAQQKKGLVGWVARRNIVEDHVLGKIAPALEGAKVGYARDEEAEQFMQGQTELRAERRNNIERAGGEGGALDRKEAFGNSTLLGGTYLDKDGKEQQGEYEKMTEEQKQTHMLGLDKQIAKAEQAVKDTNVSEISNMPDQIKLKMTPFMDMSKYEALQKNEEIPKTVRESMKEKMQNKIKSTYMHNDTMLTDEMKKLTGKQIEVLGTDWALENADLLTNYHMDDIKKSGMMSDNFFTTFSDMRKDRQVANMDALNASEMPEEIFDQKEIEKIALNDDNRMMYKVKRVLVDNQKDATAHGVKVGEYANYAKLKGGKDIANHIHADVAKQESFAPFITQEWIVTHGANDRNMTKLNLKKRENIERWNEELAATSDENTEIGKRANKAKDYLKNSQAQKNFLNKLPDRKPANSSGGGSADTSNYDPAAELKKGLNEMDDKK